MSAYVVDSLEIKVQEKTQVAKGKIDELITTLYNLKTVCRGGAGLNEVANALDRISRINAKSVKSVSEAANAVKKTTSEIKNAVQELNGIKIEVDGIDGVETGLDEVIDASHEASKEIKQSLGSAIKEYAQTVAKAHPAVSKFVHSIGRVAFYRAIRSAIKAAMDAIKEGYENAYQFSRIMNGDFASSVDDVTSRFKQFKNQVGSIFSELFQSIAPILQKIIERLYGFANTMSQVFAVLNGKSVYKQAQLTEEHWKDATKAAKEYKSQVLGIDELNIISEQTSGASSATEYADMFKYANVELGKMQKVVEWIRDNFSLIKDAIIAITTAITANKVLKAVTSIAQLMGALKGVNVGKLTTGLTLSISGFTLEFLGGFSMGKEGANLKNMIQTAIGGALGIAGGLIAFGATSLFITIPLAIAIPIVGYELGLKELAKENFASSALGQELEQIKERVSESLAIISTVEISVKTRQDTIDNAVADILKIKTAIDRVFEIDSKADKTISEVAEMQGLIKSINDMNIEGIQLDLDKDGKIVQTKNDLYDVLRALLETKLTEIALDEMASSLWDVSKATEECSNLSEELKLAQDNLTIAQNELNDAQRAYEDLLNNSANEGEFLANLLGIGKNAKETKLKLEESKEAVKKYQEETDNLNEKLVDSKNKAQNAQEQYDFLSGALSNTKDISEQLIPDLNEQSKALNECAEAAKRYAEEMMNVRNSSGNGIQKYALYGHSVGMYASGGIMPNNGQLFIANESGAEMVGSWGNQTGVANNGQIVAGIQQGVASAVSGVLAPYLAQIANNTRETANKDFSVNIGDRDIARANARGQRAMGASLITVG